MAESGRRFIANWSTRNTDEFKAFAQLAARLSPHGKVLVGVGGLADKAFQIIPEGGSAWHEYSAYCSTLDRFFPHPALAPHWPADWVKANQALLRAKAAILAEMGLGASFHGNDPHFWPESFWREHPHLRGPRIDHPRRSRKEEFAVCTDLEESRGMIEWMMVELRRSIPTLGVMIVNTNDAGSGFCWAAAQYAGPNGPRHCRNVTAGERVRRYVETLKSGARKGGGDISVYFGHANFWRNEVYDVAQQLPPDSYVTQLDATSTSIPLAHGTPARSLVNPLATIEAMERLTDPRIHTVFLDFGRSQHHGTMPMEPIARALDIVIDCIEKPAKGRRARLDRLQAFCVRWAGEKRAEALVEAFCRMDQALRTIEAVAPQFRTRLCAVSMRHLTRPLVFKPELLTSKEEDYFLPFVFNIRPAEARGDYIDVHGGRMQVGSGDLLGIPGLDAALEELRQAAGELESMKDAPAGRWLFDVATSARIHASMIRSINNLYFGQKIRDRCKAELARGEPLVPEKTGSWDGGEDILAWNERMRDELDNANELIALFEQRGTDQISHAEDERHQSTFLLGPDLVGDLKKKVRVMRDHWLDVERYIAPPHK